MGLIGKYQRFKAILAKCISVARMVIYHNEIQYIAEDKLFFKLIMKVLFPVVFMFLLCVNLPLLNVFFFCLILWHILLLKL